MCAWIEIDAAGPTRTRRLQSVAPAAGDLDFLGIGDERGTGSFGRLERPQNSGPPDVALQQVVMDLVAKVKQQQCDIDQFLRAASSHGDVASGRGSISHDDEAACRSGVAPDLEVASQDEYEEAVNTVNLACVAIYKVATANSLCTRIFAALWVLVLLSFTLVSVFSLLSICIGVAWPKCYIQKTCPLGTACVFVNPGGDRRLWLEPTCQDCLLAPEMGYPLVLENVPFGGKGFSTTNASQLCASALGEAAPALGSVTFHRCLYVGTHVATMSFQDRIALCIVFLITSGLMTKDAMQHGRARQLRELILPLDPIGLGCVSSPCTCEGCGKLCAVLVVKFVELLLRNMVIPLVVLCLIMLILTQGTDAASLLLNGLSVGFFMEIDDLIPSMILRDAELDRVSDYLKKAAQKATRTDRQFQGKSQIAPIVCAALATWYFGTLVWSFSDATRFPCNHLIFHFYYRVGLVLGLWIPGVAQSLIYFLEGAYEVSFSSAGQSATVAVRAKLWLRVFLRLVTELLEMCLSAWLMNIIFWYSVTILYYGGDMETALGIFDQLVNDIFGTCVKGFNHECTEWLPQKP